ncbi:substrate-binding domain-containing protein [Streptomyces niveus]|uniref:substrate-binding domain-containing protein n=1 Tax=Streptomyces niveus TaxID=193462 RepID=UPI00340A6DBD
MPRFDPRGRVNRALLVGVPEYDHIRPRDLAAVDHNLTQLSDVLRTGKIFGADEITVCRPEGVDKFTKALNDAVESAEGLLLFYFAGHGAIPAAGDELWLQMRNARVVAGSAGVFQGSQPWSQVLGTLASSKAKQIVVILDCCHAGNAARVWEAFPDKRHISQLMSVQANNLIGSGSGEKPTPFTEQLVRILRGGVGGNGGDVCFQGLSEELRAYMTRHWRTQRSEEWEPQSRPGTSGADVLLATDLPPVVRETPRPWWRRNPVLTAVAAGLVPLLGWGTYVLTNDAVNCAPPLELRLLTDPDLEPTVREAAASYLTSDANHKDDGCRRSGITTYSAGATDVVAAFRDNSEAWQEPGNGAINPQRDIGAQPDIWIPAVSADAVRARSETGRDSVTLAKAVPLASSPIVLAVPEDVAGENADQQVESELNDLVSAFLRTAGHQVLRSDPEFTDAALLATRGLYGTAASGKSAEKTVAPPGLPAPTGLDLLCQLPLDPDEDKRTAVLVPEHLLKPGVDCEVRTRAPRKVRYPTDVPGLDPAFVRVTWEGANLDKDARHEAADSFRTWLEGEDGQKKFSEDGFGKAGDAEPVSSDELDDTLAKYRNASGPGRVLFLLDSSGSMEDRWQGPSGAPGMLKQSLGGLGSKDTYGVWAVGETDKGSYTELLAFESHKNADAAATIDKGAQVKDVEADPYKALTKALDFMGRKGVDDQHPRLIVYVTDNEESAKLTSGDRLSTLTELARKKEIPVATVSLESGACEVGKPNERIASASGGRCLDTAQSDLMSALQDEVARTGSGDQE